MQAEVDVSACILASNLNPFAALPAIRRERSAINGFIAVRIRNRLIIDPLGGREKSHKRSGAARPARKRSLKPAQRKLRKRFSRWQRVVSCPGLIRKGTEM
jgi:hypothetical protein